MMKGFIFLINVFYFLISFELHQSMTTSGPQFTTQQNNSTSISVSINTDERKLDIIVNKTTIIQLPKNNTTLSVRVKEDPKGKLLTYQWKIISVPKDNSGSWDGKTTNTLNLSNLIEGTYQFQIVVTGNLSKGVEEVEVIVKPPKRRNLPPVAIINPSNQTVELPSNVIIDGSQSTDDSKIVEYHWEIIKGVMDSSDINLKENTALLDIKDIHVGQYTFKLTVTDDDGAKNSTTATVIVQAGKDYPPKADPGPSKIIFLPNNSVVLNGSASKDDKRIVSYQWTKKSNGPSPDILGVKTPILRLSNLLEGDYVFNLKVTDSSGQSSDKDVSVFVKARKNVAPVARATINKEKEVIVRLPSNEAVLNGSTSYDDDAIVKYHWEQIGSNENQLKLVDADKAVAYVSNLKIGEFKFKLTVWDKEQLSSSEIMTLKVNENKNQQPKAKVLKEINFTHLTNNIMSVDGSLSWDDHKIVKYLWIRDDDSLAIGDVLNNSDTSPVLLLTNLYPGQYQFQLKVFDEQGLYDTAKTLITVLPSKLQKNLVEVEFTSTVDVLTEARKNNFLSNIELLLQNRVASSSKLAKVVLVKLKRAPFGSKLHMLIYAKWVDKEPASSSSEGLTTVKHTVPINPSEVHHRGSRGESQSSGAASSVDSQSKSQSNKALEVVPFHPHASSPSLSGSSSANSAATTGDQDNIDYVPALTLIESLNELRRDHRNLPFYIKRIETVVCQNNCSNHGVCNPITKFCECEGFWTSSTLRDVFGDQRPNCDWSVIYMIILFAIFIVVVAVVIWVIIWAKRRHENDFMMKDDVNQRRSSKRRRQSTCGSTNTMPKETVTPILKFQNQCRMD